MIPAIYSTLTEMTSPEGKHMIPLFKPSYDEREWNALREPLSTGWIGLGPKTREFEGHFAEYIGSKYAVATNSATAALHLSMLVSGIEGKEVITTPITFISTNHAILYNKGIPVFCDVESDSLNIDPLKIEALITPATRMIVPVHYGGYSCDMGDICRIAKKHDLIVLEDAAHACGGEWEGRKLGSIGDLGIFSFHAVKNLATGEGGMIVTNDKKTYDRLMKLRWMGISKDTWQRSDDSQYSWYYDVEEVGYKYHMSDIAAVLGLVQLSKLDCLNLKRRELVKLYNSLLADFGWVERPVQKVYQTVPSAHNYVIKVPLRNELNEFLKARGISTGVHYIPNNHYSMYRSYRGPTPIAQSIWQRLLTLPLFPDLKNEEVEYIATCVAEFGEINSTRLPQHG
jgi:perosamine synthetase